VFRRQFGWSRPLAIAVFGSFGLVDLAFFSSNTLKIVDGGWVPLVIGLTIVLVMTTWRRGRSLLIARWQQDSLPLASFLARLPQSRIVRVPGTAVFMTGNLDFVPNALLHNLKHNKVLHEQVFFVTVRNLDVPQADPGDRIRADEASPGIYKITMSYGFMESPNVPRALESLSQQGIDFKPMSTSYFVGRETVVPASVPKLRFVRRWLFLFMARNAVSATEFFRIPSDRVVELGVRVAI
jgi:KUP system potassium uptake protein